LSKIKVCIAARIDHSKYLAEGLSKRKYLTKYITFGAQTSFLKNLLKFLPTNIRERLEYRLINIFENELKSSFNIYLINYLAFILLKDFNLDIRPYVHEQFEKYVLKRIPGDSNIVHLWSLYFKTGFEELRNLFPNKKFISDVYEAYTPFVDEIVKKEYLRLGFHINRQTNLSPEKFYERYEKQDTLVVPSEYVKSSFLQYFPQKKIFVNPYGINNSSYKVNYDKNDDKLKIIYCGTVSVEKGAHTIIEIATKFPQHSFTLVGNVQNIIKQIYLIMGRPQNVIFLGHMPHTYINNMLLRHDLYIHPSLSDAYSLSVSEAIGVGLPVIISDNTGIKDVVIENGLGLVFKTSDVNDLTDKLSTINRKWLIETNFKISKVINHLSWDDYVNRMISIYEELINEPILSSLKK